MQIWGWWVYGERCRQDKAKYYRKNIAWKKVSELVRSGYTTDQAYDLIYNLMINDKYMGVNFDLLCIVDLLDKADFEKCLSKKILNLYLLCALVRPFSVKIIY